MIRPHLRRVLRTETRTVTVDVLSCNHIVKSDSRGAKRRICPACAGRRKSERAPKFQALRARAR